MTKKVKKIAKKFNKIMKTGRIDKVMNKVYPQAQTV